MKEKLKMYQYPCLDIVNIKDYQGVICASNEGWTVNDED